MKVFLQDTIQKAKTVFFNNNNIRIRNKRQFTTPHCLNLFETRLADKRRRYSHTRTIMTKWCRPCLILMMMSAMNIKNSYLSLSLSAIWRSRSILLVHRSMNVIGEILRLLITRHVYFIPIGWKWGYGLPERWHIVTFLFSIITLWLISWNFIHKPVALDNV